MSAKACKRASSMQAQGGHSEIFQCIYYTCARINNMSGRKNRKWEGYKQQHAQKRRKKEEKLPDSVEYLTVQRLTAEVEGKCQKYGRVGPLSIVPFKYESLTLENTKSACKKHFDIGSYMECDVLAGERGSSYTSIEQIKSHKLLHVRFYFTSKTTSHLVMDQKDEADGDDSIPSTSFQVGRT